MDSWRFKDESDPEWYRVELDPKLGIDIPVGTWQSVLDTLKSNALEVRWFPMMIDIAPWIDCDGNVYPGRLETSGEWVVMDSAGNVHGTMGQTSKQYLEYNKEGINT